jgi:hypothetical protein
MAYVGNDSRGCLSFVSSLLSDSLTLSPVKNRPLYQVLKISFADSHCCYVVSILQCDLVLSVVTIGQLACVSVTCMFVVSVSTLLRHSSRNCSRWSFLPTLHDLLVYRLIPFNPILRPFLLSPPTYRTLCTKHVSW